MKAIERAKVRNKVANVEELLNQYALGINGPSLIANRATKPELGAWLKEKTGKSYSDALKPTMVRIAIKEWLKATGNE